MLQALSLLVLFFSMQAFAAEPVEKNFSYVDWGNDGFSRNYYSCDFAENSLKEHLQILGATDIKVSCSGGINHWGSGADAVFLRAKFTNHESSDGRYRNYRSVKIGARSFDSDSACFFNTKLLEKLLNEFPNVVVDDRSHTCFDSRSRWNYELRIGL